MDKTYDVAVVGGGLTGPLLGLALSRYGMTVALVDAGARDTQSDPAFDGRAYALSASSVALLRALDVWDVVEDNVQAINDIKVSDGRAGEGASPMHLHFDHRELDDGPFGFMLEDRYLRGALQAELDKTPGVTCMYETRVTGVAPNLVTTDKGALRCGLIIGCDGRRSAVAKLSGIRRNGWDYDQTSIVCALNHELPHNGMAHQFFTPAGPLAILPLPGNRSSIVWTENRARAEEIMGRDEEGFLEALRPVFGDFLGDITLTGSRYTYPLGLSLADSLVAQGVVLVGDAAHGIHPLAGQGLNLGMRDIAALTEVLVDARRRGENFGSIDVLERYQRWRRFDMVALAAATDGLNRLFSNDNPILRLGRDLGLAAVGKVPSLRRRLMLEAAGLTGDMPKLLRGLPI